ncbi:TVP38/TMEM64 family protein [Paraclostridium ghonii]|uniref:TVP38/TMEM64 family membrane protein n=1 Tax=Paraclostridium ghonii TaxID=29358 RepID=A0ABU0MWL4_9FIRM|nr:TVP38/TMEM64 family protein [Paeniclostridium ghonii]MDQ0555301.1 putative membrane protein YdjX (TVP38/TMEM64 family) [Paeniclostridium ghonii]
MNHKFSKFLKILLSIILILIIGSIIYKILNMNINPSDIQKYVTSFGKLAPLVYIVMFALVPLTLFPDSVLAIGGGLIFGLAKGYLYTLIGALLGASLSFYISRKLGRNFVKKITKEKLDNIEEMINSKGFFVILLLRLIPLFPFDIISYGAGLTNIKYRDFLFATIVGTIPGILVFTNIGAQSVDIGSNSFYISIMALILLLLSSILLKNKLINTQKK